MRDAAFVEFTADCNDGNIWGTDLQQSSIDPSIDPESATLRSFLAATPKWERVRKQKKRRGSTWVNSLDEPSCWLPKNP